MKKNNNNNNKGNTSTGYWLYGKHTVASAINNPDRIIVELIATKQAYDDLSKNVDKSLISRANVKIADRADIDKAVGSNIVHQGIAIKVYPLKPIELKEFLADNNRGYLTFVVLDNINDPQNLGAILRSSAAFEVDAVIISKDNAPKESAVIAKASCGAIEIIPIISVTNISESIKLLKSSGFWVVGLDGKATSTFDEIKRFDKLALIFGSEGEGLRKLTRENCDLIVSIPISDNVESLNLSNAVAISLFQASQRG
jgi:23S rRNA (guanosine2251-2'-O)-methyltransferase